MTTDDDGLTSEERRAFDVLPREQKAPAELEERTVAALKEAGLLITPGRRWSLVQYAAAALALVSCLAIGFAAGAWMTRDPILQQPDYVLLLRAAERERQPATDAEMREKITEYASWASDLAQRGELLSGAKLESSGWLQADIPVKVPEAGIAEGSIQGYFLIKSTSYDEAVRIAKNCPHVRYGGSIEVRRIQRF